MRELDHIDLMYSGAPRERVVVTVEETGTSHLVTFKLDEAPARRLPRGTPITFDLKDEGGERTDLQLTFEFNAQGSYEVTVRRVTNCEEDERNADECVHTFHGPPLSAVDFSFFVG